VRTWLCLLWLAQASAQPVKADRVLTPLDSVVVDTTLRSLNSDTEAIIRFVNVTDVPVDIYWIDFMGDRVLYLEALPPGGNLYQLTFLTHPWLAVVSGTDGTSTEGTGRLLAGFLAARPNQWSVPPSNRANADIAIVPTEP
jgi:hypothetical protein